MKAEAVVFTAPNTVELREIDCPEPGAGDVVVRITHSWISNGTEGSYLRGERVDGDRPYREGDVWPFPVVAGYQKIGVVEWVGADIDDLEIGETVFATIGLVEGMHHWYAGHVSPSVCPRGEVFKLPEDVEPLSFAAMVLAQVGYNGGMRAPVEPGDVAVVVGDGMVGHWTAQTLSKRGAEVVLVGRHDDRLAKFADWPGAHLINESNTDWPRIVQAQYPEGIHIGIDTVGSIEVMEALTDSLRRFGHLVSAGFYGTDDQFSLQPPRYKELSVHLVSGWTRQRLEATHAAISNGTLDTLSLITHRFPVRQAAEAWHLIEAKAEPVLGVILDW